jgi:phosphoserine phosphatase RsbU/P
VGAHADEPFEVYADVLPAREVGGDFHECFTIDDTHVASLVADVSGSRATCTSAAQLSKDLMLEVARWTGTAPQADDTTVLALGYRTR